MDQIKDVCRRMEDLCADGNLPRFDRVRLVSDPDELWFVWDEGERVVVVELEDDGADAMIASMAKAAAGDAVLN